MASWDPANYLQFADERGRPFIDLVAGSGRRPRRVVDLGCGPGNLTASLAPRWPERLDRGRGLLAGDDRARAPSQASERLRFRIADLRDWQPSEPVDVIVSNATLQWVPDHRALLPRLVDALAPDGWLAFQVPGNFDAPSHRLAARPRRPAAVRGLDCDLVRPGGPRTRRPTSPTSPGSDARSNAWETTYLHVLTGPTRCSAGSPAPVRGPCSRAPRRAARGLRGRLQAGSARPTRRGRTARCCRIRRIFVVAHRPVLTPDHGTGLPRRSCSDPTEPGYPTVDDAHGFLAALGDAGDAEAVPQHLTFIPARRPRRAA